MSWVDTQSSENSTSIRQCRHAVLMIARGIQLPQEVVGSLGMGGLVPRCRVAARSRADSVEKDPASRMAEAPILYQMHCQYGVEIGRG